MLISCLTLLTSASLVSLLSPLVHASPPSVHPHVDGISSLNQLPVPAHRPEKRNHQCPRIYKRRAWHVLTNQEKQEYIRAEKCLMGLPSKSGLKHARTRFDDLQAVHQLQGERVHLTGFFLPFHRLILHAHETLLRTECGYNGTQPYWDESPEAGDFSSSAIFSPTTGFGGDGRRSAGIVDWTLGPTSHSAGCIVDGPFKDYRLHIGPGMDNKEHCISRSISNSASWGASEDNVQHCMSFDTFANAWPCIETNPHNAGHRGVGGEMFNPYSSPGDPLFYLHHAWLDKVWWEWQSGNLAARVRDITGKKRMGDHAATEGMVGLGDTLKMLGVVPDAKVGEVMDLKGRRLCVEYENPPPRW